MQKKSKIIIISIVSALILLLGVVTAIALTGKGSDTEKVATEKLSLGQKFLLDLEYDKAVAEFQAVIDIEPKNVDAYMGLAEAYIGMGDEEKAIETLEKGLSETGDEKIQAKLDEMKKPEETTAEVTTVATTTAQEQPEMTMEELFILNEKFVDYLEKQSYFMTSDLGVAFPKELSYESTLSFLYVLNYSCFSEEEKEKIITNELMSNENVAYHFQNMVSYIGFYNGAYSYYSNLLDINAKKEKYISLKGFVMDEKYQEKISGMDEFIYECSSFNSKDLGARLANEGKLCGYQLEDETLTDIAIKQVYDYTIYMQVVSEIDDEQKTIFLTILDGDLGKVDDKMI